MKIGFCGGADKLHKLNADVIDYAEVSLASVNGKTDAEIKEWLEISKASGIPIETANCFFPPEIKLCGKGYSQDIVREYCKSALCKGAGLGIELAVVGSGRSRKIEDNEDRVECYKQLEESFYIIADIAMECGIIVVAEPLSKGDTNSINTVSEGADFVRKVNHPNLFLLADIFHMSEENESYQSIIDNCDLMRHIHIARGETRKFPRADDGFDYMSVKDALTKAGYDMRISIEGRPYDDFNSEIEETVKFLKSIFCK